MSEKSWASLAPLLDSRRYVESIVAGIKIHAHADFRICATMNDDASTFELPEYIHSRLQPQVFIDFPEREEEKLILAQNLPFADDTILNYVVDFLQMSHLAQERYTVRDGINIGRYAIKLLAMSRKLKWPQRVPPSPKQLHKCIVQAIHLILGQDARQYLPASPETES
jgi:MoxR-like ATPase